MISLATERGMEREIRRVSGRRFGGLGLRRIGARGKAGEGFNPAQAPGLFADYDAAYVTTVAGPKVSTAFDQAAPAQDISQATDANRPAYSASNANFLGRPTMDWGAGADQVLKAATASDWKFLHDGTGMTVYFVFRPTSAGAQQFLWQTNEGSGTNIGSAIDFDGTNTKVRLLTTNGAAIINASTANATCPLNQNHIVVAKYLNGRAGFEFSVRVDATTAVTGNDSAAPSGSNPTSPLGFGGLSGATLALISANVPRALFYAAFHEADTESAVKAYLKARYGTV